MLKLAAVGVKAVRVYWQSTGHFASVVSGEFSFGRSQLLLLYSITFNVCCVSKTVFMSPETPIESSRRSWPL